MTAKELIEKANRMHSEISEQRKIRGIWRERYHSSAKKTIETSDRLRRILSEIDLENPEFGPGAILAIAEWMKAHDELKSLQDVDPPPEPDIMEWMNVKLDAVEELARETGLRLTVDS